MKKIGLIALVVVMVMAAFAGCAQQPVEAPAPAPVEEPAQTPEPVKEEPAEESAPDPVVIKVAGSTSVAPVIEALAELYTEQNGHVTINVESTGSGAGVTSAGDGTADIGMASREIKDEEMTTYPDMKISVLCLDGVAVVVNADNPVKDLTAEQIADIYAGKIKNWKEVGGDDKKITLYSRDASSGTRGAFTELLLEEEIDDTKCIIVSSGGAIATGVEGDVSGIGYISLGVVDEYNVTAVKIHGTEATIDNVISGTYEYFRNFNLLTLGDATGELAAFIDFCINDQAAKDYMMSKGYIAK